MSDGNFVLGVGARVFVDATLMYLYAGCRKKIRGKYTSPGVFIRRCEQSIALVHFDSFRIYKVLTAASST
jgi:hypothetical protein